MGICWTLWCTSYVVACLGLAGDSTKWTRSANNLLEGNKKLEQKNESSSFSHVVGMPGRLFLETGMRLILSWVCDCFFDHYLKKKFGCWQETRELVVDIRILALRKVTLYGKGRSLKVLAEVHMGLFSGSHLPAAGADWVMMTQDCEHTLFWAGWSDPASCVL